MRRGDCPPHRVDIRTHLLPATTVSVNFVHFTSVVGVSCECRFPSGVIFTVMISFPQPPILEVLFLMSPSFLAPVIN